MNLARIALVSCLFLAAGAPGCKTPVWLQGDPETVSPAEADWRTTDPFSAPSFGVVWDRVRLVLAGEGYRIDEARTRADERLLVTTWSTYLAPTRYEGVRRRAHAEIVEGGAGSWSVRIAVMKQRNTDIRQPMNPSVAKWENVGAEETRAALMVWKIANAFRSDDAEKLPAGGIR
jgi:hypothetical protein